MAAINLAGPLAAIVVLIVGVMTFASIGLMLGGVLKAEAAVAAGSVVYLAFSFLGGVFVPRYQFPPGLRRISQYIPSERMVHAMLSIWMFGKGIGSVSQDLLVMILWALGALLVSSRFFRWE